MLLRICVLVVTFLSLIASNNLVQAQTPATGSVVISGSLLGPAYPCGSNSCPTYDSGQVSVNVGGYTASVSYGGATTARAEQLASSLAAQLNTSTSPVTAVRDYMKITLISKQTGAAANYTLAAAVKHSTLFPTASFDASPSGTTLTGGTGTTSGGSGGGSTGGGNGSGGGVTPPTIKPIGTLLAKVTNNTSLCSSSSDPGGNLAYCAAFFNGFKTNPTNLGAQTLVPDSPAGHISDVSVKQLMYPGWNGQVLCHYMPWFGSSTHKSVGYNENSSATVAAQASFMISEGCDVVLIDYYGSQDPHHAFHLATVKAMFANVSSRTGYPLKLGLAEDKGALKAVCPVSGQTAAATVTCLQTALINEMDYIKTNFANSPAYWHDGGQPMVGYFGGPTDFPVLSATDWDSVWSAVKAHTDNYTTAFKFMFQYGGKFTSNTWDNGRYAWAQPPTWGATQQFWWGSRSNPTPIYLDSFYSNALTHPSQLAVGALYKAFDDNNASWSGNRVVAQQCGQVLMDTASEIAKFYASSGTQLPYVQLVTWNDYEEGTALEGGIDNCYTVNASMLGNMVSWSLVASDPVYASTRTIHHFNIYFTDTNGTLYLAAKNLASTANSLDLSQLVPTGTWNVYVEMVGQPLIINRISNGVQYIH